MPPRHLAWPLVRVYGLPQMCARDMLIGESVSGRAECASHDDSPRAERLTVPWSSVARRHGLATTRSSWRSNLSQQFVGEEAILDLGNDARIHAEAMINMLRYRAQPRPQDVPSMIIAPELCRCSINLFVFLRSKWDSITQDVVEISSLCLISSWA